MAPLNTSGLASASASGVVSTHESRRTVFPVNASGGAEWRSQRRSAPSLSHPPCLASDEHRAARQRVAERRARGGPELRRRGHRGDQQPHRVHRRHHAHRDAGDGEQVRLGAGDGDAHGLRTASAACGQPLMVSCPFTKRSSTVLGVEKRGSLGE